MVYVAIAVFVLLVLCGLGFMFAVALEDFLDLS